MRNGLHRTKDWPRPILIGALVVVLALIAASCSSGDGTEDSVATETSANTDDTGGDTTTTGVGGSDTTTQSSDGPPRGGILTFAASSTSAGESLDPALAIGPSQYMLNTAIYDTLTYANPDDWIVEPRLAESWEADDALTQWRFSVRPGVTFHNGDPLTADDVVYSLRRAMDPEIGSLAGVRLARTTTPEGIQADGELTVVIDLESPDSLLPQALSFPQFSIVQDGQTDFTLGSAVGTGPFIMTSFEAGGIWEAERNPDYWDGELPYIDGLRRVVSAEPAAATQAVISGEFDIAEAVDPAAAGALGTDSGAYILPLTNAGSLVLVMDTAQAPFDDPNVRQAFKLAVDRELVNSVVYGGYGVPTSDLPLPPDDPYYPDELGVRSHDPEEARRLLAEAGYPDGIDVTLLTGGGMTDLATVYADLAEESGINVTLEEHDMSVYWDVAYLQAPFYMTDWQGFFPPDFLWYTFGSDSGANESKLPLTDIDDRYDEALATLDSDEQRALVQEGLTLAAENMGLIIPVSADALLVVNDRVHGIEAAPIYRFYLREVYIDQE